MFIYHWLEQNLKKVGLNRIPTHENYVVFQYSTSDQSVVWHKKQKKQKNSVHNFHGTTRNVEFLIFFIVEVIFHPSIKFIYSL